MSDLNYPGLCPICRVGKNFIFTRNFVKDQSKYYLYQCTSCSVQFWWPQTVVSHQWYEKEGNPYSVRNLASLKVKRGYHKFFLNRYRHLPKDTKVLDLGCGTGEFLAALKERGCQVFGLDFDMEAIKIAKQRFGLENMYALSFEEFFKKNDLPEFDIVTFFEVIEHLDKPQEFILNIKKLLKPSGKIVLSTPSRERMLANLNNWDFPPHHLTRWNEEAISKLFSKCGFDISYINYVEELKIISESVASKSKTGLVSKSLALVSGKKKSLFIPKTIYFLGRLKDLLLGKIPAIFLWIFGKIVKRKNGIILVELKEKISKIQDRKKVLFFIPILALGGGEKVVSELSLHLPKSIEKVIVLLENQVSYPYKGKIICLNIPIANPFLLRIYYFFIALLRMRRVVKEEKPDYIISFGTPLNIINVLSSKKAILRVDNFLSSSSNTVYNILIKLFFNKTSEIVCVSKASAKDLVDNFGIRKDKIRVIYNPLDTKKIQELAKNTLEKKYQKIFEKPVVINMGRISRQKGQWYLVRAFLEVKKIIKEAQLVILGTGELDPQVSELELRQLVKDLGLENDVHLLGWQKNPFKFLAKAKVFVLSSLWEGLPYGVLEAMACGLPVISADCKSGPREILAPKTDINKEAKDVEYAEYGILMPAFDGKKYKTDAALTKSENILKQTIVELLTNKRMANDLARKSKQRAADFDIKSIIKEWKFLENGKAEKIDKE